MINLLRRLRMHFFKINSKAENSFILLESEESTGKVIDDLSKNAISNLTNKKYTNIKFVGSVKQIFALLNAQVKKSGGSIESFRVLQNKTKSLIMLRLSVLENGQLVQVKKILKSY